MPGVAEFRDRNKGRSIKEEPVGARRSQGGGLGGPREI